MGFHLPAIIPLVYLPMSVVTFVAYGCDKRRAALGNWRIKEHTLHLLELLGGWPGAFVAQRAFHHKWRKTPYMIAFWAIVVLHIAAWTFWFTR